MSCPARPDPSPGRPLVFAHIGDLHLTGAGERNDADTRAILADLGALPHPEDLGGHGLVDFLYLPGDLAEDGRAAQYALLREALDEGQPLPVRLICGDHDRQHGSLDDFRSFFETVIRPEALPDPESFHYAETVAGVRCLFLDLCSAGFGSKRHGLDFRLGPGQLRWLAAELEQADRSGQDCAVFMHSYPADLRGSEAADVAGLLRASPVRLVEMGHTHYNELAHDGRTLYAAARSVGQNEDGSIGYAVAAIDRGVASWRFKPLDRTWPFVLITAPADRRLATAPRGADEAIEVRALVLGDGTIEICRCRADNGFWVEMHRVAGDRCYAARLPWPPDARRLSVQAIDARWHPDRPHDHIDTDVIEPAGPDWRPPPPARPGSDAYRVGAWLERGVRGDQLGPNRNGRHW